MAWQNVCSLGRNEENIFCYGRIARIWQNCATTAENLPAIPLTYEVGTNSIRQHQRDIFNAHQKSQSDASTSGADTSVFDKNHSKIFKELCFFFCNLDTFTIIPNVPTVTADHEPENNEIKVVKYSL